jgi:outer membrane protein assembly factor BamE (lipoprotein component of BamABCDE complex)
MKKLIISVVLSVPLFLASFPVFSTPTSTLYNSESITNGAYLDGYNNSLPIAGINCAY